MTSHDEEFKEGENQKTKQKRENNTGLFKGSSSMIP